MLKKVSKPSATKKGVKKTVKKTASKSHSSVAKKSPKTTKKSSSMTKKIVAIGSGVAALGAATYYLFGPNGKKHQKNIKTWASHMKRDVEEQYAKAEKMTQSAYHDVVDKVAKSYAKNGKAQLADVTAYAKTLKKQWKGVAKKATTATRRTVKKVTKK